ncbi:MAG TPA: hypothetical protein DCW47_04940 [Lachnospiraceae bacterium]|nr:hypothetical protein [Lachnospiraceae bacterium]
MSTIALSDLIPVDILQEFQDAFSEFSGMASIITDNNGQPITTGSGFSAFCMELTRNSEKGRKNCELCDRQGAIMTLQNGNSSVYRCHAGIMDFAAPIMLNGEFIGSFIAGQVLLQAPDEEMLKQKALEYGIDPEAYIEAARKVRLVEEADIEKAAAFLTRAASVFSKIAYQRYLIVQKNQSVEDTARTQSEFLTRFSDDMVQSVRELFLYISDNGRERSMEEIQKNVDLLLARTMKLGSIVEDSVEYVNAMNGIFELNESVYDIRRIAELKLSEFIKRAEERNDSLSFNVDQSVPKLLMGDSGRIGTIIGKLIENSIRYTENAQVHLHISSEEISYSTILVIDVTDGGVGIEEKQAEYIRNYMSSRGFSDTRDEEFEMLGFSLIGYCVNAMSGTIDLQSVLGKGTRFVIKLPQLKVEGGPDE